jgi:hypothetical protein
VVRVNRDSIGLVCLRTVSNGAKPGALPTRLKVLEWGVNKTLKGDIVVDEETLKVFSANQRAVGRDRVALDFEHNTVPGTEEFNRTQEPRMVAGFWTPKVIRGEGVVLEAPKWVAPEREVLAYEDISATPFVEPAGNGRSRVIGLHSVGLTRAGASDFTFLSAPEIEALVETLSVGKTNRTKTNMQLTVAALAGMLGLEQSATEADVKAKLDGVMALSAKMEALERQVVALGANAGGKLEVIALSVDGKSMTVTPTELAGKVISLEGMLNQQRTATENAEKDRLIACFSGEGKVPLGTDGQPMSNDSLRALSADELRRLLANTAVTVPLSVSHRNPRGNSGGVAGLTAPQLQGKISEYRAKHGCDFETAYNAVTRG